MAYARCMSNSLQFKSIVDSLDEITGVVNALLNVTGNIAAIDSNEGVVVSVQPIASKAEQVTTVIAEALEIQ